MIIQNLPALQVVVPLLCAPLSIIFRSWKFSYTVALAATWSAFAIAIMLLLNSIDYEPISYYMGGWEPPVGIEYKTDILNSFILVLVTLVGSVALPYSYRIVENEIAENKRSIFFAV